MANRSRNRARGITGLSRFRKIMRKVPDILKAELQQTLQDAAEDTATLMRGQFPVREGDLIRSVTWITSQDKLTVVIGPGIKGATTIRRAGFAYGTTRAYRDGKKINFSDATRKDQFQLFKAYWLEYGTKKGVRPQHNVAKVWDVASRIWVPKITAAADRALKKAAAGVPA